MHDKMALFNMRPPELLCIDSVVLYFQSFDQQKHSFSNRNLAFDVPSLYTCTMD